MIDNKISGYIVTDNTSIIDASKEQNYIPHWLTDFTHKAITLNGIITDCYNIALNRPHIWVIMFYLSC